MYLIIIAQRGMKCGKYKYRKKGGGASETKEIKHARVSKISRNNTFYVKSN